MYIFPRSNDSHCRMCIRVYYFHCELLFFFSFFKMLAVIFMVHIMNFLLLVCLCWKFSICFSRELALWVRFRLLWWNWLLFCRLGHLKRRELVPASPLTHTPTLCVAWVSISAHVVSVGTDYLCQLFLLKHTTHKRNQIPRPHIPNFTGLTCFISICHHRSSLPHQN